MKTLPLFLFILLLLVDCSTLNYQKFMNGRDYVPMDNVMLLHIPKYDFMIRERDFFNGETIRFFIKAEGRNCFALSADGMKVLNRRVIHLRKINGEWHQFLKPDFVWGTITIRKRKGGGI